MKESISQIEARLREQGVEVAPEEIESRLRLLVETFAVPQNEATRSVVNYFLKEHGITPVSVFSKKSEEVRVKDISASNCWVDLKVKVVQLWDPTSDAISQIGLVGDGTGVIKFVKWVKSGLPDLAEGQSYLFKNVVTDEFQDRFGVKLNRTSKITELEEEIEVSDIASAAPAEEMKISDIVEPERWIDLKAKVVQLWDPTSDAISQTGLIGDDTGVIKFVKWVKSDLPELAEGQSYLFKNVVSDVFQDKFSVKLNRTSEISELEEEIEVSDIASATPAEEMKISDIVEPERWIDLRAKVVQLWDPTSDAISQIGLVGDDTGVIKFVKWVKSDLPELAEGQSYLFKNVVTDVFQDRFSVKLNRTSEISELEEEIEVSPQIAQFSGAMVDIQKGSGLIKRCPVCRRALAKGVCGEHGRVEGTYDLRIKAVMDDGNQVQEALINRETTERLMGITLDEAKEMAMEALDHEIVMGLIEERLMGRYYKVTGPQIERYILVETVDPLPPVTDDEVAELMREAEAVI